MDQTLSELGIVGADVHEILVQPRRKLLLTLVVPSRRGEQRLLSIRELQFNDVLDLSIEATADPGLGTVIRATENQIPRGNSGRTPSELRQYEIQLSRSFLRLICKGFTTSVVQEMEVRSES